MNMRFTLKTWGSHMTNKDALVFFVTCLIGLAAIGSTQDIFDSDGKPFSKVHRRTKEPKFIADTVRMSGGFGSLSLRDRFTREGHDVTPTSTGTMMVMMTPEMVDTTDTPPTYGWQMNVENNRLVIVSSNANDSLRVGIVIVAK